MPETNMNHRQNLSSSSTNRGAHGVHGAHDGHDDRGGRREDLEDHQIRPSGRLGHQDRQGRLGRRRTQNHGGRDDRDGHVALEAPVGHHSPVRSRWGYSCPSHGSRVCS